MSDVVVEKFSDAGQLVDAAAARLVTTIVDAQKARGFASIVLTGGGTGIALLEKLREAPGDIDWSQIDLYWGDERFLPSGDPELPPELMISGTKSAKDAFHDFTRNLAENLLTYSLGRGLGYSDKPSQWLHCFNFS